jgi:hypothetical protein
MEAKQAMSFLLFNKGKHTVHLYTLLITKKNEENYVSRYIYIFFYSKIFMLFDGLLIIVIAVCQNM